MEYMTEYVFIVMLLWSVFSKAFKIICCFVTLIKKKNSSIWSYWNFNVQNVTVAYLGRSKAAKVET